jgi:hypothetical protein
MRSDLMKKRVRRLLTTAVFIPVSVLWVQAPEAGVSSGAARLEAPGEVPAPPASPRRYAYNRTLPLGLQLGPQDEKQRYEEAKYEEALIDLSEDKYFQEAMEVPEDEKGIPPAPPETVDRMPSAAARAKAKKI